MIKNNMNRIFQIKMDECIVFQKLSDQENNFIILKYLNSNDFLVLLNLTLPVLERFLRVFYFN